MKLFLYNIRNLWIRNRYIFDIFCKHFVARYGADFVPYVTVDNLQTDRFSEG